MSPNKYIKLQPQCEKCNSISDLLVHHIDQNRENNTASNLIVLCTSCHALVHKRITNINKMRWYYSTHKDQMQFKFN
jgi:hypothetical protein